MTSFVGLYFADRDHAASGSLDIVAFAPLPDTHGDLVAVAVEHGPYRHDPPDEQAAVDLVHRLVVDEQRRLPAPYPPCAWRIAEPEFESFYTEPPRGPEMPEFVEDNERAEHEQERDDTEEDCCRHMDKC